MNESEAMLAWNLATHLRCQISNRLETLAAANDTEFARAQDEARAFLYFVRNARLAEIANRIGAASGPMAVDKPAIDRDLNRLEKAVHPETVGVVIVATPPEALAELSLKIDRLAHAVSVAICGKAAA